MLKCQSPRDPITGLAAAVGKKGGAIDVGTRNQAVNDGGENGLPVGSKGEAFIEQHVLLAGTVIDKRVPSTS
jgi:hypothetical protein